MRYKLYMKHIFFCQGVFKNTLSKFHGGLCPVWGVSGFWEAYTRIHKPSRISRFRFQQSSAEKQFDCEVKAQRPSSHACQWHTAALHSWFPTCFDIHKTDIRTVEENANEACEFKITRCTAVFIHNLRVIIRTRINNNTRSKHHIVN